MSRIVKDFFIILFFVTVVLLLLFAFLTGTFNGSKWGDMVKVPFAACFFICFLVSAAAANNKI